MSRPARLPLAAFAVLLLLGGAVEALACSCVPERPVCEGFGGASAVFVGRVVGSAERKESEDQNGRKTTYDVGTIYFAVEETFSGVRGKRRVEIHSGTGGGDCGFWFLRGQRYLVYADASDKGRLHTNICTRTRPLSEAAEDLAFLRDLPPAGTGARIYGIVARPAYTQDKPEEAKDEGIPGIKVIVTGPSGRRELFTDAEGRYEISNLKAGVYKIDADLPPQYHRDELSNYKRRVYDRGCASADFPAIPNGVVAGRVLTAEGETVEKPDVVLLRADATGTLGLGDEVGASHENHAEGRFEIGQVPPGEYVLGINLTGSPKVEFPYPPTYFPGVTQRSEATVIKLGLGEKVSDLLLRLPPPLSRGSVSGVVVWPDGARPSARRSTWPT